MPGLKRTSAPATEPVTQAEAQLWLKQSSDADDAIVDLLIAGARELTEEYCQRAWITQTWEYMLDSIPESADADTWKIKHGWPLSLNVPGGSDSINIPRPPLISVTSIEYYDTANTEATFSSASYTLDTWGVGSMGRVYLNSGYSWPSGLRDHNAILVTYVAGYGAAAAVPSAVKTAMRQIIEANYDWRAGEIEFPKAAKDALSTLRIIST